MEKKETRGRKATGRKLKTISFAIDSELYDQYNAIVKEKTQGTKKNGAGISLNTFIKNNLDHWIKEDIKDISENMVYYIPTEEEKEKMATFYRDTPAKQSKFIKETMEKEIKERYFEIKYGDMQAPLYYIYSLYFEKDEAVQEQLELLSNFYIEVGENTYLIEDLKEEIDRLQYRFLEGNELVQKKLEKHIFEVPELSKELKDFLLFLSTEFQWFTREDLKKEIEKLKKYGLEEYEKIYHEVVYSKAEKYKKDLKYISKMVERLKK